MKTGDSQPSLLLSSTFFSPLSLPLPDFLFHFGAVFAARLSGVATEPSSGSVSAPQHLVCSLLPSLRFSYKPLKRKQYQLCINVSLLIQSGPKRCTGMVACGARRVAGSAFSCSGVPSLHRLPVGPSKKFWGSATS